MRRLIAFSLILAYFKESAFVHTYIHVARGVIVKLVDGERKLRCGLGVGEGKRWKGGF